MIVAGALIAAAGIWYLSRTPARGTYPASLLPGLMIMAIGIGAVLVSVTTAANAGVPADRAGLAAGLLSASQQLGTALGLAIFSAIATARTSALLTAHAPPAAALTAGFRSACWPGEDVLRDRRAAAGRFNDRPAAHEGGDREAADDCAEVRHRDQVAGTLSEERRWRGHQLPDARLQATRDSRVLRSVAEIHRAVSADLRR